MHSTAAHSKPWFQPNDNRVTKIDIESGSEMPILSCFSKIYEINFKLPGTNGQIGIHVPDHAKIKSNKPDQEIAFSMVKIMKLSYQEMLVVAMSLANTTLEIVIHKIVVSFISHHTDY